MCGICTVIKHAMMSWIFRDHTATFRKLQSSIETTFYVLVSGQDIEHKVTQVLHQIHQTMQKLVENSY